MAKKDQTKISNSSPLEDHIKSIIEKVIEERDLNLAAEDIKIIVREVMPDLDRLISKKVKKHFHAVGLLLMETFKPEE